MRTKHKQSYCYLIRGKATRIIFYLWKAVIVFPIIIIKALQWNWVNHSDKKREVNSNENYWLNWTLLWLYIVTVPAKLLFLWLRLIIDNWCSHVYSVETISLSQNTLLENIIEKITSRHNAKIEVFQVADYSKTY